MTHDDFLLLYALLKNIDTSLMIIAAASVPIAIGTILK